MSKGLEVLERLENDECYTDYEYRVAYDVIRKELKALEIVKSIVKDNISEWGNVDFNINDYPLLKEVLNNE